MTVRNQLIKVTEVLQVWTSTYWYLKTESAVSKNGNLFHQIYENPSSKVSENLANISKKLTDKFHPSEHNTTIPTTAAATLWMTVSLSTAGERVLPPCVCWLATYLGISKHVPEKCPFPWKRSWLSPEASLGPAHQSPHSKQNLDRLVHFCRVHIRVQQTQTQRDRGISVTIGRISWYAQRRCLTLATITVMCNRVNPEIGLRGSEKCRCNKIPSANYAHPLTYHSHP